MNESIPFDVEAERMRQMLIDLSVWVGYRAATLRNGRSHHAVERELALLTDVRTMGDALKFYLRVEEPYREMPLREAWHCFRHNAWIYRRNRWDDSLDVIDRLRDEYSDEG